MTTNLVLDARQRAMLAEMGVRVWLPSSEVTVTPARARHPDAVQAAPQAPTSLAIPVRKEPPLRLPVLSTPPVAASLSESVNYVIGNMPTSDQAFEILFVGEPCTGDAEKLLLNIQTALGRRVFVAHMVASPNEAVNLADQIASLQAASNCKRILALGPHAAKALLGEMANNTPFGKLRGMLHALPMSASTVANGAASGACKLVVTYHPMQLLRRSDAKAQAWQDLKLALT